MHQRYVITLSAGDRPIPAQLSDDPAHRAMFKIDRTRVVIDTPDAPLGHGLRLDRQDRPARLILTEGVVIPAGDAGLLQSGSYNQLIIDDQGATLHNDTLATLPCYYSTADGILRVSNSLRLLRQAAQLAVDDLGVAQLFLLAHCVNHDRTILKGVHQLAGGVAYRFELPDFAPRATRTATTWTHIIDEPPAALVERICALWQGAVARYFDAIDAPIGLMLSGGLDSRLVGGGLASRGRDVVALTHGNQRADEVGIAKEVAATIGAVHLTNGMDDAFTFDQLALADVHRTTELMYNPMWHASALRLAAEGVTHFTTGAGFDVLLGGERLSDPYRRFARSLRLAVVGPRRNPGPAQAAELEALTALIAWRAEKRARNYGFLLTPPIRTMLLDSLPAIREEVAARMAAIAAAAPVTATQVGERFAFEHGLEQLSRAQERQLLPYGTILLPTYDRDLLAYLTNLSPGAKCDHYLYYRVFGRLYPQLARLRVTGLGNHIARPQLLIELERARRILYSRQLTSWVNFNQWIGGGGRLAQYEALFLAQDGFFDPDAVRTFFNDVRAGRKSLYDGNETLGFLNVAWLLDDRSRATLTATPATPSTP